MHGGRIYGGGNVYQLKAKSSGGKRELANVAHEGDIGIVDGNIEVGLVVQTCRLIRTSGTWSVLFLGGIHSASARGGIEQRTGSDEKRCCWQDPRQAPLQLCLGILHGFHLNRDLASHLER